ncbi:hypothetical protein HDU77_007412 [Chytriomyces hyalinus]|nr:hypothetical protein HDU77_007412 [Chytriomyces hyalinus]
MPTIEVPKGTNVHHEGKTLTQQHKPNPILLSSHLSLEFKVELAVIIDKQGRDITAHSAMSHVGGYALAIDATARDLQDEAKKAGKPWSTAKGFDTFTPIGDLIPTGMIPDPNNLTLWLKVNGEMKQNGPTSDMLFKIPQLIEYVSSITTLERGDVILTGTPAGVGKMSPGDVVDCGVKTTGASADLFRMQFRVVERPGFGVFGTGRV